MSWLPSLPLLLIGVLVLALILRPEPDRDISEREVELMLRREGHRG